MTTVCVTDFGLPYASTYFGEPSGLRGIVVTFFVTPFRHVSTIFEIPFAVGSFDLLELGCASAHACLRWASLSFAV